MAGKNVRLFVANLPWTIGNVEFRNYFRDFGKITTASVVFDRSNGVSKGFGFVTFKDKESSDKVFNAKNHVLDGNKLIVQVSTNTERARKNLETFLVDKMAGAESNDVNLKSVFLDAAKFLESVATELDSTRLLELYSYYKQANHGKCNAPKPNWFNMTARQKWDAWNSLGDLSQEKAMLEYIGLITQLFPEWQNETHEYSNKGWVAVSSMPKEQELEETEKRLSDWVREGDTVKVKLHAKNNIINLLDDEGLGPIHWAADRGNLEMLECLVGELDADVELKDQDGQSALHYAAACGHAEIVKYLLDHGANSSVKDSDGATPLDVASESNIINLLS